ncbi:cell division ATP-binding protein FtsE [Leptolyngbya sp. KIOST-1]|uniref:cell division ATP-binding protein FtsE n=1 Tax=Leptolyngbya sp. KIOST-1 TaxID=1229172 RepID=UPI000ABD6007|nr:cell division ATP-binding protein FtsE [Leptolyngbya sp. KIOST-1]
MTSVLHRPTDHAKLSSLPEEVRARLQDRFKLVVPARPSIGSSPSPELDAAPPSDPNVQPIVSLTNVEKTYGNGSKALMGVNLSVNPGDFLFVTGPSGSGKSTLLKLLYGYERPTSGSILVADEPISNLRGNRLAMMRRRIGVVFQDYKLIPKRTVAENVAFVLWAQGFSRKEIHRRLWPTLKMVGLQGKAQCFPDELSGGEQQRVSIARAVVNTPPLLLADEPTGNLDADNSLQVIKILKKLNSIGITVIVTTHDEHLVRISNLGEVLGKYHPHGDTAVYDALPTLKMVGLQGKAQCFPDELSGGEQQRVSIARAVVNTPPLLLADEPTGNLDADNSLQVIKILKKLNSIGITVIVTTHDEHLVRISNHPVVQIKNGRLHHLRR